jgi:hypothetical protein
MKYFPMHVRTDLDKLTIDDVDELKLTIGTWVHRNGKTNLKCNKKTIFSRV